MNALLRQLYGPTESELIADIQRASQRLSIATRSWSVIEPSRAAIDEIASTAHGLQRTLAQFAAAKRS